jgi:hypothetical protein
VSKYTRRSRTLLPTLFIHSSLHLLDRVPRVSIFLGKAGLFRLWKMHGVARVSTNSPLCQVSRALLLPPEYPPSPFWAPRTFFVNSTDRSVPYSAAALLMLSLFPSLDSTDPSKLRWASSCCSGWPCNELILILRLA